MSINQKIKTLQNEIKLLEETKQKIITEEYDKKQIHKDFLLVDNRIECYVDSKFVFSFSRSENFSNYEFVNDIMNLNCSFQFDVKTDEKTLNIDYIEPTNFTYIKKLRNNAYLFRSGTEINYIEFHLNKEEFQNLRHFFWKI